MALHIMCRAFFSVTGNCRRKETVMKMMTVRKRIAKWRKDRELNKILRDLDASLQDLPEELQAVNEDTWDNLDPDTSEIEGLISLISAVTAVKTADDFTAMVDGKRMDIIDLMLNMIENTCPKAAVRILKGMFYACGMEYAAERLDIIDICSGYCEDAYENFINDFMQTDDIDWFMMEDTLKEAS